MLKEIDAILAAREAGIIALRRRLHACPEPGFAEFETSRIVAETLGGLGCQVQTGIAGTGVVGFIAGRSKGPTIALRSDMDALPLTEETGLPFASKNPGMMHACGHDAHLAIVLGAAAVLVELRQRFAGGVKLIFQPAEELLGGGKAMVEAGVLEDPRVDAVLGVHVWPQVAAGKVGFRPGPVMAALDSFRITLTGKSSHAATPHLGRDALVAGAYLVTELQGILSREIDPLSPAVLSVGRFQSGTASNVVADAAELLGTVRTLDESLRQELPRRLKAKVDAIAAAWGVDGQLEYTAGYPTLRNDPALTLFIRDRLAARLGEDALHAVPNPSLTAEDFAYFAERVPATYLLLGVGQASGVTYPLHHPKFYAPDEAVVLGIRALVLGALGFLTGRDVASAPSPAE
ncbi:MAG: M20 metallopeptidase family protein [Methanocella sp.]